ncbi:hypothetical protein BDN67DRAFT_686148 [Paxillus ammoniavirescens]|nr:hypothetical protein BDN67DRAFT_686148 [Paxillus ammoniavirescens]
MILTLDTFAQDTLLLCQPSYIHKILQIAVLPCMCFVCLLSSITVISTVWL